MLKRPNPSANSSPDDIEKKPTDLLIPNEIETKNEILDEEEFKLEPIDEFSELSEAKRMRISDKNEEIKVEIMDANFMENPADNQMNPEFWKLGVDQESSSSSDSFPINHHIAPMTLCSICSKLKYLNNLTDIISPGEKIVIMVGCVLAGEYSLQQAQYIFHKTNDYQKVCHFHLTDAMDQIFKKLEISTINDVFNCAKIEQVMNIVKALRPEISQRRFEIVLYNMKNTKILHQKKTKILSSSIKATTQTPKPMSNICALCNLQRQRCELRNVRQINEKLIIMVGWILLDYCSIKEAARFLEPGGRLVCHEHIFETIFEIFETLQIAQMKEIDMCDERQMEKIMKIVDSLSSGINFKGFSACLREFARKNKVTNGDLKNAGLTSQFDPEKSPKIEENSEKSILQILTTRCAICQKSQNPMKIIQSQNEKLVIVVGNVLRGVVTFKKAKPILAMSDQPLNFCVIHITEAIDGIFRALQREKIDEIRDSCPYMKNVMIVVNVMRPKLSSGFFVKIFQDFVKIHSKIQ